MYKVESINMANCDASYNAHASHHAGDIVQIYNKLSKCYSYFALWIRMENMMISRINSTTMAMTGKGEGNDMPSII